MIRIEKIYDGYYSGESTPPDTHGDYRCREILAATELRHEFRKRGAQDAAIDAAFAEADRRFIPIPPRLH